MCLNGVVFGMEMAGDKFAGALARQGVSAISIFTDKPPCDQLAQMILKGIVFETLRPNIGESSLLVSAKKSENLPLDVMLNHTSSVG